MKGGIYSDQRCPVCGRVFKHFEPRGLWCPKHPQCQPSKFVLRFGKITRRFQSYSLAYRELTGLRYKVDRGEFDLRDYQSSTPLGYANLVSEYLYAKRNLKACKKYEQRLRFGVIAWGNRNIKEIGFADFERLFNDLADSGRSGYYIKHIRDAIIGFWRWLLKRGNKGGGIAPEFMPQFPDVQYSIGLRKIVNKDQQTKIINAIYNRTWDFNPRIYVAISILSTYPKVRPGELIKAKERYLDPDMGRLYITDPKERKPKYIPLVEYHVELLGLLKKSFPAMPIFRHEKGNGAAKPSSQFGRDYLYNQWRKACDDVGIHGVSLYPGTKHTQIVHMRNQLGFSRSECQEAAAVKSNKAFSRYYEIQDETMRKMYADGIGEMIDLKKIKAVS